jgi:hypothetical protein
MNEWVDQIEIEGWQAIKKKVNGRGGSICIHMDSILVLYILKGGSCPFLVVPSSVPEFDIHKTCLSTLNCSYIY